MRRPHLILGSLLLGVAAAVGFYASQPDGAPAPARATAATKSVSPARAVGTDERAPRAPRKSREPLAIEAPENSPTELTIRALRVDTAARKRLEALDEQLDLSPRQQRRIFPLLARSNPEFDESFTIRGAVFIGPAGRITRNTADHYIHELLDPEQQLELEIAAAEDDIWWTHVIAELEKDLLEATNPATDTAPPPIPEDAPASEEPRTEPRSHRGGNLFDRMEGENP